MGKLGFRVYSFRKEVWKRHSFLVGNDQGGTTDVLAWIEIDNERETVAGLRPRIEVNVVNRMNRRTPLFQETIEIMNNAHNFHRRPESDRRQCVAVACGVADAMMLSRDVAYLASRDVRRYQLAIIAPDGDANNPDDLELVTYEEEDNGMLARNLQPICVIVPRTSRPTTAAAGCGCASRRAPAQGLTLRARCACADACAPPTLQSTSSGRCASGCAWGARRTRGGARRPSSPTSTASTRRTPRRTTS